METTVSLFPSTRDLKERIRFPLGAAVSPTIFESCDVLPHGQQELHTCRHCGAYLAPNCPVDGDVWQCAFCNVRNKVENSESFQNQANKSSFEVVIGRKTNVYVIYVVYLSLEFEERDFLRAKVFACSLLRNLPENGKCLVLLGLDNPGFAILAPAVVTDENAKLCSASVVRMKSIRMLVGKDLSSFFFTRENSFMAERTIERLSITKSSNPHTKVGDFAVALSSFVQNLMPIRFIALMNNVGRGSFDFETLRQSLIRLDLVVIESSPNLPTFASDLPGTVEFLSNRNPALQAKHLIEQDTKFQMIFRCHSARCRTEILRAPRPFSDMYESSLFMPVIPTRDFPIMIELSPASDTKSISLQFVSKFVVVRGTERQFVLRVQSHTFRTTDNEEEYASAVNWNCALWFWLRKVYSMPRSEAASAIFKTASSLTKHVSLPDDIVKAICAVPKLDIFNEREERAIRAIDLLLYSSPHQLHVIPHIATNACERSMCCSLNGIGESRNESEEGPSKQARDAQMSLPVYIPVSHTIPHEFLSIDPVSQSILERFIQKVE